MTITRGSWRVNSNRITPGRCEVEWEPTRNINKGGTKCWRGCGECHWLEPVLQQVCHPSPSSSCVSLPDSTLAKLLFLMTSPWGCATQLCEVLYQILNLSLKFPRVPTHWKISCVVPVPRKIHPAIPSDYRPMDLPSHVMETLERLIVNHLHLLVEPWLDPLQFTSPIWAWKIPSTFCIRHILTWMWQETA